MEKHGAESPAVLWHIPGVIPAVEGGQFAIGIVEVVGRQAELLEVVGTLGPVGGLAHLLHGRQQQGNQDADNGNHHQQFNQREAARTSPHGRTGEGHRGKYLREG